MKRITREEQMIKHYEQRLHDLHFELLGLIGRSGLTWEANKRIRSIHNAHTKLNRWKQRKFQAEQISKLFDDVRNIRRDRLN